MELRPMRNSILADLGSVGDQFCIKCPRSFGQLKHDGGIKRVMNSSIASIEIARRMSLVIVTSRAIIPKWRIKGESLGGADSPYQT